MERDFSDFMGQKVTVTLKEGDPIEGKVESGSKMGMILKYKGSSRATLIEGSDIVNVEVDNRLVDVKASQLKWPKQQNVRKHLATYHGYSLASVNAMSNEKAMEVHDSIHTPQDPDMGHFHSENAPQEDNSNA